MRSVLIGLAVIISLSACASKSSGVSDKEYYRSNSASEKALDKLDRE